MMKWDVNLVHDLPKLPEFMMTILPKVYSLQVLRYRTWIEPALSGSLEIYRKTPLHRGTDAIFGKY